MQGPLTASNGQVESRHMLRANMVAAHLLLQMLYRISEAKEWQSLKLATTKFCSCLMLDVPKVWCCTGWRSKQNNDTARALLCQQLDLKSIIHARHIEFASFIKHFRKVANDFHGNSISATAGSHYKESEEVPLAGGVAHLVWAVHSRQNLSITHL